MKTKIKIKEELTSMNDLKQVMGVMKQLTANQLRQLEKHRVPSDIFSKSVQDFFSWFRVTELHHPLFRNNQPAQIIVLLTSDRGFVGGLNTAVIEKARGNYDAKRGDQLVVMGERGTAILRDLGYRVAKKFPEVSPYFYPAEIDALKDFLVSEIVEGRAGKAIVVYSYYQSISHQEIRAFELFPCTPIPYHAATKRIEEAFFQIETDVDQTIAYLLELWSKEQIYSFFWHSKLSELASRTMNLEQSEQELQGELRHLTYEYFRRVHEDTDRNIREIVAARSQLKRHA